ncbi:MAG: chromosome partitioning protein ParA, partial [Candidatus Phocaeicola excrementipullorum]|nr:chromosome partitioning protein ParA [Candidatus Phocaeicola excrementipullorum]
MQTTNSSSVKNSEQGINVIDLLMYFAFRWKWFLLSVLICGGIAWLLYARAPLVYFRSATVIIKDPSNKTSTAGLDRYDNFINKVNVANEILQFRSKKLMREVVRRVHADVSYQVKDGLRYNELYSRSPVAVAFPDALPGRSFAFTVTPKDSTTVAITDWKGIDEERAYTVKLNDTLMVGNERIVVTATNYYGASWMNVPVRVQKVPLDAMVGYYLGNIGIRQEEDESSILTLSLKDSSPARAEDMLNMLIAVYNEEAVNDKNQVAINTADFINERLIIIESELGGVESDLEAFKRENQIVDISSEAGMYMSESQKY